MAARILLVRRLAKLALLAAFAAVGVWWLGHVPYDPEAIYRPIPHAATAVGRHLALPARWEDLLENPLAVALMRTAGADAEAAAELTRDEESRKWFEKLAGREGTLAYLPGRFGGAPAWMAASHLGGESQKLRWQLTLFRVPGFERMEQFPGRSVWRVSTPDLDPRMKLAIAFGEGILMACLSENPFAIAEVLGAYDGTVQRLMDDEPSFRKFAKTDGRTVPDRFWIRDGSREAGEASPGIWVEVGALSGEAISLTASSEGLAGVPRDGGMGADLEGLAKRAGEAPCAAALVPRETLRAIGARAEMPRAARHAVEMALEASEGPYVALFMEGEFGGRLGWGAMRTLGLSGLRVPTVVVAAPVGGEGEAAAAVQRMLDASNARYRAAFVLRPVAEAGGTVHVLESAGGNEWVDELARSDRPAYAVADGWLLAASNQDALRKLVRGDAATAAAPAWAEKIRTGRALAVWIDLARGGKVARDAIATWSMAQAILGGGSTQEIRERLNEAKAWIDALAPFGEVRAELGRRAGRTELAVDFGLSAGQEQNRMAKP